MDIEKRYKDYKPGKKWFKILYSKIVFFVLGKALKGLSRFDEDAINEIKPLREGFIVKFEVAPYGPSMALQKKNGILEYLGQKNVDKLKEDMSFVFRNIEPAFAMLSAQKGFPQIYSENSVGSIGDPSYSMVFYRISNLVQFYLWPKIIAKIVLKDVPDMTIKKFITRIKIYLRIFI